MSTWMQMDQFTAQVGDETVQARLEAPARCPADYPIKSKDAVSYWMGEYPIDLDERHQDATLPAEVDVAIIGSGITGAAAAYRLSNARPDLRVAVLEARGICTGATGRNGGHLARPEAFHLRQLKEAFGPADAIRIRQLILRNRDQTLEIIKDLGIADAVDLRLGGTLTVYKTAEERETFMKDLEYGIENGLVHEARSLSPEEVLKIADLPVEKVAEGGAYISRSGTLFPRKLVHELLKHALSKMSALTIHPYTPVRAVTHDGQAAEYKYEVVTDTARVRAKTVFHATNAYASYLLPPLQGSKGVFGCKCQVMAVQPNVRGAPYFAPGFGYDDMWHWIAHRPNGGPFIYGYSIYEPIADYDDTVTAPIDHEVRSHMFKFLPEFFPKHFTPDVDRKDVSYDWTGIQGYTTDGASMVGRPFQDRKGEFMSVGHNGEGMTRCVACATVVMDALLHYIDGRTDDWAPPDWFPRAFRKNI